MDSCADPQHASPRRSHRAVDPSAGRSSQIVTFVTLMFAESLHAPRGRPHAPEIVDGYRTSGDRCSLLKVRTDSIDRLEGVLDRMAQFGQTSATVVSNSRWDERR